MSQNRPWRRKMNAVWGITLALSAALNVVPNAASADGFWSRLFGGSSDSSNSAVASVIQYDEAGLQTTYGAYSEVEYTLAGSADSVTWSVTNGILPLGLELDNTPNSTTRIFGTPLFSGEWCFVLSASSNGALTDAKRVCYVSIDNPDARAPKFHSERYLKTAVTDQPIEIEILVQSDNIQTFTGTVLDSNLPDGIEILSSNDEYKFLVRGTTSQVGIYSFSLDVSNENNVHTAKQFQLTVVEKAPDDQGGEYSCPSGYYYDRTLGRCVQNALDECPTGTYYDPSADACVQYPAPPPTVICQAGYYFDPFLSQCVPSAAPRCPLNYSWDNFYDRCVRQPYTCSIGSRYDWARQECVYVWQRTCSFGSYFDPRLDRCVTTPRACGYGYYWNTYSESCQPTARTCNGDDYWDPILRGCHSRPGYCGPGYTYDPIAGGCRWVLPEARCGWGTHWSPAFRACVADRVESPRPRPVPRPPVIVVPAPRPPARPPVFVPGNGGHEPRPPVVVVPTPSRPTPGRPLPPTPRPDPRPRPAPAPAPQPPVTPPNSGGNHGGGGNNGGGNHGGGPRPEPQPAPAPRPAPIPAPAPVPRPAPEPRPAPRPVPQPEPRPAPQPAPVPRPAPEPRPAPRPAPQPAPRPAPQPAPQPAPAPPRPRPTPPAQDDPHKPHHVNEGEQH